MAQPPKYASREGGFARAELSGQVDDEAGLQRGSERGAEGQGIVLGGEMMGHGRHRGIIIYAGMGNGEWGMGTGMRGDPSTIAFAIVLAVCVCLPALAAEPAAKSRKKAESALDASAMDKRIADSKHVFVGEGVRIYFVNRRYQETPYIRAEGGGAVKSAVLVVKVVRMLHPAAQNPGQVLVPIETSRDVFGTGNSPYDREVERLVGKQGIWFGEIVVRSDVEDGKPFEDPVTLLQTGSADAKRRPTASPLPMRYLKEVTNSIARKGASQAAALKTD
jgi:hypothetical protein